MVSYCCKAVQDFVHPQYGKGFPFVAPNEQPEGGPTESHFSETRTYIPLEVPVGPMESEFPFGVMLKNGKLGRFVGG